MMPRTILQQLARLRWRERGLRLVWRLTLWLVLAATVLAMMCGIDWLIDRWEETPRTLRERLLAIEVLFWSVTAGALALTLILRRLTDTRLALWVEEKVPDFQHRLISALQLNRPGARTEGMSPALIGAVTQEAEEQAGRIHFPSLADHRRLKWCACLGVPLLLAAGGLVLAFPETVAVLVARQFLSDRPIPRTYALEDLSREVWPSGEDVVLRFRVHGPREGRNLHGEVRIDPGDGRPSEYYPLAFDEDSSTSDTIFVAQVPALAVDYSYHGWLMALPRRQAPEQSWVGGLVRFLEAPFIVGRTSSAGKITCVPRPAILEQRAWARLPRHTGVRPDGTPYEKAQLPDEIVGVYGSTARVEIKTERPIVRGTLEVLGRTLLGPGAFAGPEVVSEGIPLDIHDEGTIASAVFDLRPEVTAYRLRVWDEHGFENLDPPRRKVRVVAEEPPQVALVPERFLPEYLARAGGRGPTDDFEVEGVPIPLGGSIRVAYSCSSEYGLGHARFHYRVNEGDWLPWDLKDAPGSPDLGPFHPRRGAFQYSKPRDQIQFHRVPSPDRNVAPDFTEGGGRFDFQTKEIPNLKIGDQIEFFVEVFNRDPKEPRAGRSESRLKTIVTLPQLVGWIEETLRQEDRIRQLDKRQRGVFDPTGAEDGDTRPTPTPAPVTSVKPTPATEPTHRIGAFVTSWHLLGPFADPDTMGHERVYPPEKDPIDLGKEYDGIKAKIGWQLHRSTQEKIDLASALGHREAGVAYAVCWVNSLTARPAQLATGSDDGIKVWLNRKPVLEKKALREAIPGEDRTPVSLAAGWNELLVKVDNRFGTWAFFLELRDPATGQPLTGISIHTAPPGEDEKRFVLAWQLLGPFPNVNDGGFETAYPPETEKTDLGKEYDGLKGKIRWQSHASDRGKIDLEKFFGLPAQQSAVAYAVCWVYSHHKRSVLLATGSDDGIKVWVNRKLVLSKPVHREAVPGDDTEVVELPHGWNELLVKVDNRMGKWGFYFEVREPVSGKPLSSLLRFMTSPNR